MKIRINKFLPFLFVVIIVGIAVVIVIYINPRGLLSFWRPTSSPSPSTKTDISQLPSSAQSVISATLGKDDARYAVSQGTAANPANNYSTSFSDNGIAIISSASADSYFSISLANSSYEHPIITENRVSYERDNLIEWYINGPLGIQQGFTIPKKQSDEVVLTLNLVSDQFKISEDKKSATITTPQGKKFSYTGLTASDSKGTNIPVWLEDRNDHLVIVVDTSKAIYPVTIN